MSLLSDQCLNFHTSYEKTFFQHILMREFEFPAKTQSADERKHKFFYTALQD